MANTFLVKTILHKSLAEGVYKDVVTRSSSYYYFLGKTLSWDDDNTPPLPVDSQYYEKDVRTEIITIKEIKPSDVAFVVPRKNWVADVVYDMFDDQYCDEVLGIDIISGGAGYIDIYDPIITITGGGGEGATAMVTEIYNGSISKVALTSRGRGYTSTPKVTVSSVSGREADLQATMGISATGQQKLEDCNFYVVTDEYNVYKCIDNNNNARSRYKPTGTQIDPIKTLDGYLWKFMYNIPINLRNKFYTDDYIPVVTALTNHFYSNGTVDNIFIANKGSGYSSAVLSVTGDGYRESDPIYITGAQVISPGSGYVNPDVTFGAPFSGASQYIAGNSVNLGQKIYNSNYDYYEVITPGVLSTVEPTHKYGNVLNGTSTLKYVGTRLKGSVVLANPKNIIDVVLTQPGAGYTSAPNVTVYDSTGTGALLTAEIGTSTLANIVVSSGGTGYVAPILTCVGGGASEQATLQATVSGGIITDVTVISAGAGYTSNPTILIEDSNHVGADAVLVPELSGSPITKINIVNGGNNYSKSEVSDATPTGTLTSTLGSTTITGTGTLFTAEVVSGQVLKTSNGNTIGTVTSIPDDTTIQLLSTASIDYSGSYQIWNGSTIVFTNGGGSTAKAEAVIETGVIDSVVLQGSIREVIVVSSGSGYIDAPDITFYGNSVGSGAIAKTKLNKDTVLSAYVVDSGDFYQENDKPSVIFGNPYQPLKEVYALDQFINGSHVYTVIDHGVCGTKAPEHTVGSQISSDIWFPAGAAVTGETVYYGTRLYKILNDGIFDTTAPTHTSGIQMNGDVELEYLGVPATLRRDGFAAIGYVTLRYGAGYSVNPESSISDAGTGEGAEINFFTSKSEAKISAITENGQISYVVIDDPGVGYTKATIKVTGEGEGASLIPDLSLGSISSQQANNEILTPAGTIDAIKIVSRGYSYGVANVIIEGDGTGATAEAVIDPITNSISKINITSRGQDYTYANVRVIGNGQGAVLRAIISPYGGHGKNSPEELFARTLMFYSNISTDLNQGVDVGNDYRQVGIIKNPRVFDGYESFQGPIGSGCCLVQSIIDVGPQGFKKDDEVYVQRNKHPDVQWEASLDLTIGDFIYYEDRIYTVLVSGISGSIPPVTTSGSEMNGTAVLTYVGSTLSKKRYRIVSVTDKTALLQSLDNDIPDANDVFIKSSTTTLNKSFTAVAVTTPSFDKYSGQMMYIDNKQGFTPSGDETITLRTIIKF